MKENLLRKIPAVDEFAGWWETGKPDVVKRQVLIELIRDITGEIRQEILAGEITTGESLDRERLLSLLAARLQQREAKRLVPLINATGVILHTNLGRAVLGAKAVQAVTQLAANYSNLELDLATGERGSRYSHLEAYLRKLTGAEAALVVNNNAAAVLLVLAALGREKEAIVSRGELVEIGGAFRIPDVMQESGVKLVEVGTTNKTYCQDYEQAITGNTGLLLKVHTSNYRIVGFTRETTREELVKLGRQYGLPVVEDLGSGSLIDLSPWGIYDEPMVQECVAAGVDVITFSGDKLLGGPQAGIIVGAEEIISRLKQHPLTRAVRIDKFTVAALEATLKEYLDNRAVENIPTLRLLAMTFTEIQSRVEKFAVRLNRSLDSLAVVKMEPGYSKAGGGALPLAQLPTLLVAVSPLVVSCEQAAARLRQGKKPVLVRIQEGRLLLDLRTVLPDQEEQLQAILCQVLKGEATCAT